jgi:hypothetical protein
VFYCCFVLSELSAVVESLTDIFNQHGIIAERMYERTSTGSSSFFAVYVVPLLLLVMLFCLALNICEEFIESIKHVNQIGILRARPTAE